MPYSPTFFFSSGNLPIATRTRLRAAMGIFRFSAYPLFRLSTNAIKDTVSVLYWYEELSRRNSGNFWNSSSELFFVSFLLGGVPGGGPPKFSSVELGSQWWLARFHILAAVRLCKKHAKQFQRQLRRGSGGHRKLRSTTTPNQHLTNPAPPWGQGGGVVMGMGGSWETLEHTTGYDHTWLKAPYPVRFVKLSSHRLS